MSASAGITGGATVSASAGVVILEPGAELVLDGELELTLRIGEDG